MGSRVVKYEVDESTVVGFEIEAGEDWGNAGTGGLAGRVRDAVAPAVEAAKVVLDKIKDARPESVEVKFGVKVNGEANWIVAKTSTEGSFEVTLTWKPTDSPSIQPATR